MKKSEHILCVCILLTVIIAVILVRLYAFPIHKQETVRVQKPDNYLKEYNIPKILWSYWNSDSPPEIIQSLLDNMSNKMKGWDHKHITESNIELYIQKESMPYGYTELSQQAKSDWIRLYLLKTYGGLWMDTGIIVNSGSAINSLWNESKEKKSELTGFYFENRIEHGDIRSYIESWFLMAPKGSIVIREWYEEFTKAVNMGFSEYRLSLEENGDIYNNIYNPKDDDTYLTVYAAMQYTLRKRLEYSPTLILESAGDAMFKLQNSCGWNYDCVAEKIKTDTSTRDIPYIKLTGEDRKKIMSLKGYFN